MTELFVLLITVKKVIFNEFQNYAQFLKMGGLEVDIQFTMKSLV